MLPRKLCAPMAVSPVLNEVLENEAFVSATSVSHIAAR